jgi:hypothetical protein
LARWLAKTIAPPGRRGSFVKANASPLMYCSVSKTEFFYVGPVRDVSHKVATNRVCANMASALECSDALPRTPIWNPLAATANMRMRTPVRNVRSPILRANPRMPRDKFQFGWLVAVVLALGARPVGVWASDDAYSAYASADDTYSQFGGEIYSNGYDNAYNPNAYQNANEQYFEYAAANNGNDRNNNGKSSSTNYGVKDDDTFHWNHHTGFGGVSIMPLSCVH